MRQFSRIWLITESVICGVTGCSQKASWLMTNFLGTRLICDDHKALEMVAAIHNNQPFTELSPCRIDVSYGNEEQEPSA